MDDLKMNGKRTNGLIQKLMQNKYRRKMEETTEGLAYTDFSSFPIAALVDLTSKCNLNCPWCIDGNYLVGKEITTERMLNLIDEFLDVGIKSIVYFGGGEPLIHKGISEILKKTMSVDIDYAINTNGILLSGAAAEEIARGSKWTRISIDSGNAQQYKELHEGKDFYNKIINNVEAFNKIKIGTSGVSYIVMQDNIDGIVACTKLAKDIGCDFIQFKPIYELFFDGKRQQKVYQEELIRSVFIELEKAKELQTSDFAILVTGSMDAVLKGKGNEQFKQYQTCYAQQLVTLINPINVFVCPNWRGSEDMGIGDINTHSFKEIWLSDRRKEVINNLNPSNDCNLQCLRHQINVVMDSLVRSKRMNFDILNLMETIEDNILADSNFI